MKRDNEGRDHFDLLPYIAILMSMLGCLLLVTMSVAALNMGPGAGEGWTPTEDDGAKGKKAGSDGLVPAVGEEKKAKTPVLVEWDGVTATIHRADARECIVLSETPVMTDKNSFFNKPLGKIQRPGRADFERFLDEMSKLRETHYALFAVRPSGFDGFWLLRSEFESRGIPIGYEPIHQDKSVRLVLNNTNYATRPTP
jgi:hypothetical protein